MGVIKTQNADKMAARVWSNGSSHSLLMGWRGHFRRKLHKIKRSLHNPAITVLGTYSEEVKTYVHTKTWGCFIYNSWNLEATRCPLAGEWINKLWHIKTVECYSALEIDELSIKLWKDRRNLKWVLLKKQSEKFVL